MHGNLNAQAVEKSENKSPDVFTVICLKRFSQIRRIVLKCTTSMQIFATFAILACAVSLATATFQPAGVPFKSPVTTASGFTAKVIFSNLTTPRGITFDSEQNLLVVERGFGVTAFSRANIPSAGWERTVVIKNPDFTQGIQVDGQVLYVSTATTVLVYKYDPITKSVSGASSNPYVLIDGVPGDGELTTHTLQLETDPASNRIIGILVASGPLTNIDPTARDPASGRSQIRRFVFPSVALPVFPPPVIPWAKGQVIAYGIRNLGGFAFGTGISVTPARSKSLYVVENGASIDEVKGLTAQFVNDNPSDEIEFVTFSTAADVAPKSYGFPDCTSLWNPTADPVGVPQYVGLPRGAQFSLNLDPTRDDAWCQNAANNHPPSLNFQAHSVPLDIKFYSPQTGAITSFPTSFSGDAFVSFHGSFDRTPPTGYGVVHVPFPLGTANSVAPYSFLVQATELKTCPGSCIRPVGLAFGKDGRLYVSSDSSGELFVIERSLLTPL
ncbi:hypothetical protein Hypma_000295 [Hypsizygus marmoreus]|uniref:Pyrroloquinoline quinone-dependent pyranose dehydrogenase beta-propeller domain-containing protein n=1 Tax=Hypsizygus marmoreus TaxID=39966 RepID=A0A369JB79_HYPMA|nr:hypothetical protein Hypma_000295 [Hypsizygus marmoreus]